jgi:CRISPR-associated protein Cmr6
MLQRCRDAVKINLKDARHTGLLYQRYLPILSDNSKDELKKDLLPAMQAAYTKVEVRDLYVPAFKRYEKLLASAHAAVIQSGECKGRLVIGLGNTSPVETGLTLHHTYGTPFLPGSALKGLAAHYCDQVWGQRDPLFKKSKGHHQVLFGSTEESGSLIFHDAWMEPASLPKAIQADIMTVHHSDYYTGNSGKAPTDFDEPTPIPFVSLTGKFLLAVSCAVPDEKAHDWSKLGMTLLREALREWGIGGKTSSGYGRIA